MTEFSLGQRCLSEFLGTGMLVGIGISSIANEVLPKTKAHGGGFLNVALAFGFAVFVPLATLGHVSAQINPAFSLALVCIGAQDFVTFLVFTGCQLLGAFVGALIMWLSYLPHFKTVPEPPPSEDADNTIRTRDAISEDARQMAGFNTTKGPVTGNFFRDVPYYFNTSRFAIKDHNTNETALVALEDVLYVRRRNFQTRFNRKLQRRPQLRQRKKLGDVLANTSSVFVSMERTPSAASASLAQRTNTNFDGAVVELSNTRLDPYYSTEDEMSEQDEATPADDAQSAAEAAGDETTEETAAGVVPPAGNNNKTESQKLFEAAVEVDMSVKLVAFCTRPAIYSPAINALAEALLTFMLTFCAILVSNRADTLPPSFVPFYQVQSAFYTGWLVTALVLAFGGPTGFAGNPARDLAPRFAHWVLPIPGKGSSEWHYAWVPIVGPFIGAILGALLATAVTAALSPSEAPDVVTEENWGGNPAVIT